MLKKTLIEIFERDLLVLRSKDGIVIKDWLSVHLLLFTGVVIKSPLLLERSNNGIIILERRL